MTRTDWEIDKAATDLTEIVGLLDEACGRNDALRGYIFALRDLQWLHNQAVLSPPESIDAEIDAAQRAVNVAFDALIVAEFSLNRPGYEELRRFAS
jgi:hypothetical protein